jgi:hypothetical protein
MVRHATYVPSSSTATPNGPLAATAITPKEYQTLVMQMIAEHLPPNSGDALYSLSIDTDGSILDIGVEYPNDKMMAAIKAVGKFPPPPDGRTHNINISNNITRETACTLMGKCSNDEGVQSTTPPTKQESFGQRVANAPNPPPGFCDALANPKTGPMLMKMMPDPRVVQAAKMKCGLR